MYECSSPPVQDEEGEDEEGKEEKGDAEAEPVWEVRSCPVPVLAPLCTSRGAEHVAVKQFNLMSEMCVSLCSVA